MQRMWHYSSGISSYEVLQARLVHHLSGISDVDPYSIWLSPYLIPVWGHRRCMVQSTEYCIRETWEGSTGIGIEWAWGKDHMSGGEMNTCTLEGALLRYPYLNCLPGNPSGMIKALSKFINLLFRIRRACSLIDVLDAAVWSWFQNVMDAVTNWFNSSAIYSKEMFWLWSTPPYCCTKLPKMFCKAMA